MRHDQKPKPSTFVCSYCQQGECQRCVDVFRATFTNEALCTCTRPEHAGEPRDKQVLDPETGAVWVEGKKIVDE